MPTDTVAKATNFVGFTLNNFFLAGVKNDVNSMRSVERIKRNAVEVKSWSCLSVR